MVTTFNPFSAAADDTLAKNARRETNSRRKLAEALLMQGMNTSTPVFTRGAGFAKLAAGLLGGIMTGMEDNREAAQEREANNLLLEHPALSGGGGMSDPAWAPSPNPRAAVSITNNARTPDAGSTVGKIYSNDEPSPLDPPSGADRDMAVRTIIAEAGNQPAIGQQAVASVIRNRAVNGGYGGDTVQGVVRAPFQFEPHNTAEGRARMAAIDPNSAAYRNAGSALDAAYAGDDPTGGAVNFIAPKAQAALGRPMPGWAQGQGQDIGDHRFFGGQPQVAGADPAALPANATPTQGYAVPGQGQPAAPAMSPLMADYVKRLIANPRTRATGIALLQNYSKPTAPEWKSIGKGADGTERYGFVDARNQRVTPYTMPGEEPPANSVIPPVPAGVDRKTWIKEHSDRKTRESMPASYEDHAKMRGEIQGLPSYKAMAAAAPIYRSMVDSAGRDNRAADVSLIYGLGKIFDPTSVVRESEMTLAQAVATLPEQLRTAITGKMEGAGRLSPEVRGAIVREARARLQAYQQSYGMDAQFFRGVAGRNRINSEDVIPDFGEFPEWSPPAAAQAQATPAPVQSAQPQPQPARRMVWDPKSGKLVPQ